MTFTIHKETIINILVWLICFGLSFAIQSFGLTDQGTAFLWLYCLAIGIPFIINLVKLFLTTNITVPLLFGGLCFVMYGVTLLIAWGATQLLDVNFAVAFQLITLGQVLTYKP
ncbi:MAG: hypothetical protein J6B87_06610 [Clostridia bacterium]|nr:hypothetical protein [Clostridia bacterium]